MKNLKQRAGGAILAFAFVFGVYAAAGDTVQAQYRNDGQYQRRDRDRNDRERNREWRRRHRDRDWNRDRARRNDTYGTYGDYDGYGRNRGYGNNSGYGGYGASRAELNRGYQQGLETGSSDAQRNQSYNPQRSRHFKNAPTQAFREGFVRGYDEGFRQYGGYNNGGYRRSGGGIGGVLGDIFGRP
jgi:hypothetical protein